MLVLLVLALSLSVASGIDWDERVPLDDYVWHDDGYYSFKEVTSYRYEGVTMYIYNMTSQKWLDETWSNRPIWWHWVGIAIPDEITYNDAGFLWIDGGSNRNPDGIPGEDDVFNIAVAGFANDTGLIGAFIKQIPNQPITFVNDPSQRGRSEDSQIAWTWYNFFYNTTDPTILSRFPMTKACVKALDLVNTVAKEKRPETDVKRFMAAGGSKRGWTTWTLGAVDRRVIAIAPMVMSLVNWKPTIMQHYQSLGGWSFAFDPYYEVNLTRFLHEDNTNELFKHVDPYAYKERLATIPKLVVSATGDEFFLLTDTHNWWDSMGGVQFLMMNENSHHSLFPHYLRIYENVISFYLTVLEGESFPQLNWTRTEDETGGTITLTSDVTPNRVVGNYAVTTEGDDKRDFRMTAGNPPDVRLVPWDPAEVEDLGNNQYRMRSEKVDGQYVGMVMEARFDCPVTDEFFHYFMTEVNVIPDTFPVPPCEGPDDCYGTLV